MQAHGHVHHPGAHAAGGVAQRPEAAIRCGVPEMAHEFWPGGKCAHGLKGRGRLIQKRVRAGIVESAFLLGDERLIDLFQALHAAHIARIGGGQGVEGDLFKDIRDVPGHIAHARERFQRGKQFANGRQRRALRGA